MNKAATVWTLRIGSSLVLVLALLHLALRLQLINDPRVDLGGAEINVVYGIQKILLGRPLYEDPEKPPFDVMQYTPAYYGLCAGIAGAMGIDEHDTVALFSLSRNASLVLNLLTCLWLWRLCRSMGADAWLSVAVSAFTFTLYTEHFYSRTDSLYALLFVGALAQHVRWLQQRTVVPLLTTALLAVLCLFAKQTGVLVIGIIGMDLVFLRNWNALLVHAGAVILFAGLGLLPILRYTSWDVLCMNIVQGVANGTSGTLYKELLPLAIYKYYAPLHLSALLLIVRAIRKGDAMDRFLAIGTTAALLFGFATGMKHGSNINYLFEAHLLTLAWAIRWLTFKMKASPMPSLAVALAFMMLFMVFRSRQLQDRIGDDEFIQKNAAMALLEDETVHKELVNMLGLRPEDRVFITYRGHLELMLNGQGLMAQKDIIEWSQAPLYDYSSFMRMMDHGGVRFVISDRKLDTLHFLGHSWGPLHPMAQVNSRFVYGLPATR